MNDKIETLDDSFQTKESSLAESDTNTKVIPIQQYLTNGQSHIAQINKYLHQNSSAAYEKDEVLYNSDELRTILVDDISGGGGLTMEGKQNNYVTHRELDEKIKNLDDKNELRYNDLSHQIGSSKDLMISKIDSLSGKFDTIQKNMNDKFNNMKWTIGIIVTLFGIIISLIVKYR